MFFEKILKLRHTLAFRLTLWYAAVFTVSSLAVFFIFYFSISSITQRRTDKELTVEITEFSSLFASNDRDALIANVNIEAESNGVEKMFLRIMTPDGRELASSNMGPWKGVGISTAALKRLAEGAALVFETAAVPGDHHGVRTAYGAIGPGTIMQIGISLKDDEELLEVVRSIFIVSLAILMVSAALSGWFMARRALQGVEEVTGTAIAIANGAMDLRVPTKAWGEEIDRLATTFNGMLDRIHSLIIGMRDMTDNIAHDLRSPISRIRGLAEMALTAGGSLNDYESMAADTIEECDRLLEMINTMLDITEFEAGAGRLRPEEIDLSTLVREACELFHPLAEDKAITLTIDAPAGRVVRGDVHRLQRMASNLLDNAIKYSPSGGEVVVAVTGTEDAAVLTVSDTGIGISQDDLPHIFKRFYRCDQSRSQAGTGLGLSLAQAIASAHGGSITASSSPGKGSTFTVILPRQH